MLEIQAPDIAPTTGGLLGTLQAIPADAAAVFQGVTYMGQLCGHARRVPPPGTLKEFDQLPQFDGVKFSIYRGIEDSMFMRDEVVAKVTEAYDRGKGWAVERGIQELLLNVGIPTKDGLIETVDITPTTGTPVTKRLLATGLLEQYAGDSYSGLPMILTNRLGAALLDPEVGDGGVLLTKQGTPVVNAAGFGDVGPDGQVAPEGSAWVYVTGLLTLHEQAVKITPADSLKENRTFALAEGTWLATADCFVAAILVGN